MSEKPIVDGRPFVLMEAIDGARIEELAGRVPAEDLARAAVDVLLRIHSVPTQDTGIGHEEPVTLSAELNKWTWLAARAPKELTGRAAHLAQLLADARPHPRQPTLVHGDYHYGNLLFSDRRIVGILDWEIAELGQPLLDLACLSVASQGGQSGEGVPGSGRVDVSDELLLEAYGADLAEFRWYRAMTYYKYAAIFGYNLTLHRRGKRIDAVYERRTQTIVQFIDEGIRLLS
jgi:aminoglycoside phosphotransferase (APT) family kinase protein